MKMLKFLKLEKNVNAVIFILIIALLVLLVPHMFRYFYGSGMNNYFLSLSENFIQEDFVFPYGLPFVLGLLSLVLPLNITCIVLGVLLGLGSMYLFYIILKKFKVRLNLRIISCLVLSISPPFLYLFYGCNKYAIPIFLSLLAFYFFISEKKWFIFSFLLVGLFNMGILFLNLFLFLLYVLINRKYFKYFLKTLIISLIVFVISYIPTFLSFGLPKIFVLDGFFKNFVSDLGGRFGLGIFSILIGGAGLFFSWKEKKKYWLVYLGIFALLLLAIRFDVVVLYFNFVLSFLIGIAFVSLVNRNWANKNVKSLMILVFVCGLLFSGLSYVNRISDSPSKEFVEGLDFLDGRSVVFSSYENGLLIKSEGNEVVLDEEFWNIEDVHERWKDSEKLFRGNNLNEALEIIGKYDIGFVFIDNKMKREIWDNKKEGLLFVLENRFEKVFDNNVVEIWKVN